MKTYVGRHRTAPPHPGRHCAPRPRRRMRPVAVTAVAAATVCAEPGVVTAEALTKSMKAQPAVPMRAMPTPTFRQHARAGEVVTRYAVGNGRGATVRSAPTLRTPGTTVGRLPVGAQVTGWFTTSGYWFKVTSGPYAGRWIAGSLLHPTPHGPTLNGRLGFADLAWLPDASARRGGAPGRLQLSRTAADAFRNMNTAFRQHFGHDLGVLEGYRTLATQKIYANRFGFPRAAVPGTSNHGFGNAIDVCEAGRPGTSSPFFYGHVYEKWMERNAWKWGFDRPPQMDADGSNPEYWHYEFVG